MTGPVISNSPALWANGSQVLSGPSFSIRTVEDRDLLRVAQLLCESFYPPTSYWHWALPVLRVGIYQDLRTRFITQSPKHACFIAVKTGPGDPSAQNNIIGTVEVTLRSLWLLRQPVPYISNLAVAPNHRRRGVAQHLLLACEQAATAWQTHFLYLNVLETNIAAQQLYTKAQYCRSEQQGLWPRLRRSKRILLRKHLSTVTETGYRP
ncbi:hypothetical protein C1752_05084 [Acaryochloris thomasi RCC1774]|uniref:N-acetyltransferase domain-containing protein n=2 Tax=Acaryochloris TaxID=155977 RepID=A0A2W1JCK9_9CYAN|nr:hypothetical protein C1752_05084 [Acaryochloris thomasi RCC1774]